MVLTRWRTLGTVFESVQALLGDSRASHIHIQDHHVGLFASDELDGLSTVCRLADY